MVVNSCLHWVSHVIQMDDSCLPKQLFYGEMCEGKSKASKPKKKFKDSVKICLRHFSISMDQWEKMALDRSQWCKLILVGIESFENRHVPPNKQEFIKLFYCNQMHYNYKLDENIFKVTYSLVTLIKKNKTDHILLISLKPLSWLLTISPPPQLGFCKELTLYITLNVLWDIVSLKTKI